MKSKFWGVLILLAVVISAIAYSLYRSQYQPEVNLNGYLGGEKSGLFKNEDFKKLIKKKYNLTLDFHVNGSYEMIQGDFSQQDYLFPSSQLALELFKNQGNSDKDDEIVLNTPIVIYSRKLVVDALIKQGIVQQEAGTYYVDMPNLAQLIKEKKTWQDVGLNALNGRILVATTDPNKSNSGNMFLGLLANALNNNQAMDQQSLSDILPTIQQIYQALGYMQTSSSDMFNQFLRLGVGAYPLIAGYENQLLEFSKLQPETYQQVKDDIIILYPRPTVWSSHVYIALNDQAQVGIEALLDEEVQNLAWKEHGFRTIVAGTGDVNEFSVPGLAKEVTQIMPMPNFELMQQLMDAIK
ncbi:substrate-binding domain-containing protein [Ignavigranum ruoffiae]|uniref:substrate-binding domain-containing protein n=1 Tax=Ignavigranum ruoffiae TaxID=89093 RepID=UPI002357DE8A|nr:substrate-binding domain-containing protein [Ignavigranum ruoffiae]